MIMGLNSRRRTGCYISSWINYLVSSCPTPAPRPLVAANQSNRAMRTQSRLHRSSTCAQIRHLLSKKTSLLSYRTQPSDSSRVLELDGVPELEGPVLGLLVLPRKCITISSIAPSEATLVDWLPLHQIKARRTTQYR